ncbi:MULTISPECIES: hypothetical protein [unclassified Mesorhizobium]|uniref:hypothetical protein n=1 Tax=unclassified Mesorhizobium TaxID=325217 RepID=UPI000FD52F18|nr:MULTISPECIES: hypothetical protein [unclassified Mesorhizobium]RVB74795.1 hypothetical protein EN885_21085 [Mesorhizobium sp. M6A.T.Cr.TU.014.01.1.1]RWP81568.1 MAG: hypothetical protein EOR10_06045 [Mesorhizobium sp.]RWP99256.1 MAG: hypothetical protein EOR91_26800 [Mesorhizobium sp.]RWQ06234.1 MAG: hypothetical protein EOR90_12305 [Mesorhizobium sp.]
MFVEAIEISGNFTFPLIISSRTVSGRCSSEIGAAVVVNDEGWIATTSHNLRLWSELQKEVAQTVGRDATVAAIESDTTIDWAEKHRKVEALPPVTKESKDRCSLWLGIRGTGNLVDMKFLNSRFFEDAVDIGVGRLEPFDPKWVAKYPVFKDPTRNFKQGRSLCKVGFPFHQVTPTYDAATESFVFPPGTIPVQDFQSAAYLHAPKHPSLQLFIQRRAPNWNNLAYRIPSYM